MEPDRASIDDPLMLPTYENMRALVLATLSFLSLYGAVGAPLFWRPELPLETIAASLVLAGVLAALSAIDLRFYRLPDALTLPLALIGVFVSSRSGSASLGWSLVSAALGFLLLAGIGYTYRYMRGIAGLGLGDAKLLGASGAWLGAEALPTVLLWATGPALLCVLVASWRGASLSSKSRIPLGPFLSFGTWLVWLYGPL